MVLKLLLLAGVWWCWCWCCEASWRPAPPYFHTGRSYSGQEGSYRTPQEEMVRAVNTLAFELLAAHNENNENNIALSPFGAMSVLVALAEGLQGDAYHEIQDSIHLPSDISVTRVGIRDINRHLKSYFIPKEGFLAGLTLNYNVTLRREYKEILAFYGFDIESFNNGIYDSTTVPGREEDDPSTFTTSGDDGLESTTATITTTTVEAGELTSTSTSSPTITTTTTTSTDTITDPTTTQTEEPSSASPNPLSSSVESIETTVTSSVSVETTTHLETTTSSEEMVPNETSIKEVSRMTSTFPPLIRTSSASTTTTTTSITETSPVPSITTSITQQTRTTREAPATTEVEESSTMTTNTIIESHETSLESRSSDELVEAEIVDKQTTRSPTTQSSETTQKNDQTSTTIITTTTTETETTETATSTPVSQTISEKTPAIQNESESDQIPGVTQTFTTTTSTSDITRETTQSRTTEANEATTTIVSLTPTPQDQTTSVTDAMETVEATEGTSTNASPATTSESSVLDESPEAIETTGTSSTTSVDTTTSLVTEITSTTKTEDTTTSTRNSEMTQTFAPDPTISPEGNDNQSAEITETAKSSTDEDMSLETTTTEESLAETTTTAAEVTSNAEMIQMTTSSTEAIGESTEEVKPNTDEDISIETTTSTDNDDRDAGNKIDDAELVETDDILKKRSVSFQSNSTRPIRSVPDYIYTYNNRPYQSIEQQQSFLLNGRYPELGVPFMQYDTILPFAYLPHLNALALRFPLDSSRYYLLLLLPVDEGGIDGLICDLRRGPDLGCITESLQLTRVKALIPSFALKGVVLLTPTLQKIGIRRAFEPRQADFSPMTDERSVYVTNIEQAITVTIRNYLDANAITEDRNLHQFEPILFKADHPFLYFVIDSDIQVTLMAGKIVNPINSRIR